MYQFLNKSHLINNECCQKVMCIYIYSILQLCLIVVFFMKIKIYNNNTIALSLKFRSLISQLPLVTTFNNFQQIFHWNNHIINTSVNNTTFLFRWINNKNVMQNQTSLRRWWDSYVYDTVKRFVLWFEIMLPGKN